MTFANDLKEFVAGFQAGYKLIDKKSASEKYYEWRIEKERKEFADDQGEKGAYAEGVTGAEGRSGGRSFYGGSGGTGDGGEEGGAGGGFNSSGALPTFAQSGGEMAPIRNAIASIESAGSGGYSAIGPRHEKYGRPLGRYQVMESNLPKWSEQAIGRRVSPEEFLKNPKIQDAIFDDQFKRNMRIYGSPEQAASVWFTGRPITRESAADKDSLGTTGRAYVSKFSQALRSTGYGRPRPAAPAIPPERGVPLPSMVGTGLPLPPPRPEPDPEEHAYLEDEEVGLYAAEGGAIPNPRSFMRMPELPDEETGPPAPAPMSPVATDRAPQGEAETVDQRELVSLDTIGPIVDQGMKNIQTYFGFDQQAVEGASSPEKLEAFAGNYGAGDPDDIEAVHKVVDPDGSLTEDERHIAGYNAVYNYWMRKGNPEKAKRAVSGMLMASKRAISALGNMAEAAFEKRDVKGMADAIVEGKNMVPDGENIRVKKVTKDGAEFEVFDDQGRVTSAGKANINEMMRIATGMQDGTAWLEQMGAVKTKTAKENRAERDRKALEEFETRRLPSKDEFIATLNPEERKAFLKLGPSDQNRYRKEHAARVNALRTQERFDTNREDQQGRFDTNRADKLDQRQYQRDMKEFDTLVKQGRWEQAREDKMDLAERQMAQRDRDLDDRNRRQQISIEERLKRNAEIDRRIIESRATRASERAAAAAAKGPPTAGERADVAEDKSFDDARLSIIGDEKGNAAFPGGFRGRMEAAEAGAAYNKRTNDRAATRTRAEVDDDAQQFGAYFDTTFQERKNDIAMKSQFVDVAGAIRDGNRNVTREQASQLAQLAMSPAATLKVLRDGSVQIDPRMKPVFLSEDAMLRLAALHGRARTSGGTRSEGPSNERGAAVAATAGATAPTTGVPPGGTNTTTQYRNRYQRQAAETQRPMPEADPVRERAIDLDTKRQTKGAEYERLREEVGKDVFYELMAESTIKDEKGNPVVTMDMMRAALRDKGRAGRMKRGYALPGGQQFR
jgi:hypothetical protein